MTNPPPAPRKSDIIVVTQTQEHQGFRERRTPRSRSARRAVDLLRILGFFHVVAFGLLVFVTSFRAGRRELRYNPILDDIHGLSIVAMVFGGLLIVAAQVWKLYLRSRRGRASLGLDASPTPRRTVQGHRVDPRDPEG